MTFQGVRAGFGLGWLTSHAIICSRLPAPMHVEFYGVPRQRAGISQFEVDAGTLGELLGTLAAKIPSLRELMEGDGLNASFVANLNGDRFVSDPETALAHDDCVLILSADAGG